ncbi:hypothetical protein [Fructobacillus durionis]|uniref:DUF1642 domain-containing protein n=1 Tax=Fructobacillus durionis TaxID=283737 RepID=A0A1I1HI33_9LACO|nr:hypothetical protein [Fructobacillus durionis]SFC23707.1 hypothetical protein SAMN05660453_0023 [Fructobacillus durionis]
MTKKFTEEEYQKITEIADLYFDQQKLMVATFNLKNIYHYISYNEIVESEKARELSQELALIALPKSRDWAHEQFVDKEKKYYWSSKESFDGRFKVLIKNSDGYPMDAFYESPINSDGFTELEVREACYNPDMFDKEEVE